MTSTTGSPKGASLFSTLCACLLALALTACGGGSSTDTATPSAQRMGGAMAGTLGGPNTGADYTASVQQLYVAYFGRPADGGGLANFKAQLATIGAPSDIQSLNEAYSSSQAIRTLVNSFGVSEESAKLYSGDTTSFVNAIYTNVLNRTPDDLGLKFWVDAIDHGGLQRGNAALSIMAGALANTTTQGRLDAATINNKINVASNFTTAISLDTYRGDNAAALARAMLTSVTSSTDVNAFQNTIASTIQAIGQAAGQSIYAGQYSGSYGGADTGSFSFTIGTDGTISGNGLSNGYGTVLVISGTLGLNNTSPLQLQGTIGPFAFSGTIDANGNLTGNWGGSGIGGSITAHRVN